MITYLSKNVLVSEGSSKCLLTLCIFFVYAKMKCGAFAAPKELRYRSLSPGVDFFDLRFHIPQVEILSLRETSQYHRCWNAASFTSDKSWLAAGQPSLIVVAPATSYGLTLVKFALFISLHLLPGCLSNEPNRLWTVTLWEVSHILTSTGGPLNLSAAIYGCGSKNNGNTLSYLKPDKPHLVILR